MKQKYKTATDVLQEVVESNNADSLSVDEIKASLHQRGFGIIMMFFALPLCVPALPPGVTALPAIPLIMFSLQMIWGRGTPWIPKKIGNKKIKRKTLAFIVEKSSPALKKIEKLLRARFSFASSRNGEKIIGVFSLIFALSILIPLPFTNLVPALGILLMSLGLLSKDGIMIIFGIIVGSIGLTMTMVVMIYGGKAIEAIIDHVF